jgi:hypothetical protein
MGNRPSVRSQLGLHGVGLAKTENGEESFVDTPLLLGADMTDEVAKSAGVDCADLLDEHSGCLAEQIDLWAERGGPCTRGCGREEYHRSRQQLVGLDDHCVATAVLLMARAAKRAKLVHVTPEHACSP